MANNPYIEFLRRWYWLIALGVIVALAATYLAIADRAPLYRSTATLQVGRTLEEENPDRNDIEIVDRLIPAYAELATRDPILEQVADNLDLNLSAASIRARTVVVGVPQTQLIDIHVVDTNPEVAAAIADEIARQMVLQSPGDNLQDSTQVFLTSQLTDLQEKISGAQSEIAELEAEISTLTRAGDIFDAQQRADALRTQVDTWQETYGQLISAAEPGESNIVRIAIPAVPATSPQPERTALYYGLAIVLGAGIATLLALGLNLLDNALRSPQEIRQVSHNLPVATVPRYSIPKNKQPIGETDPSGNPMRAYRKLRNILLSRQKATTRLSYAVTSSRVGEGKTTTVANLGIALANSGKRVILVDANIQNPELEELFGITDGPGFCDLVAGDVSPHEAIQPTEHEGLLLIGAGQLPETYADVLSSSNLRSCIRVLNNEADIVLYDTSAVLEEQETLLLVKHLDGVVIVAESGRLSAADLSDSLDILTQSAVPVVAIAVNKLRQLWLSKLTGFMSKESRIKSRARKRRQRRMQDLPSASLKSDHAASEPSQAD